MTEKIQPRPVISNWAYYEREEPTVVTKTGVLTQPQNVYGVSISKSDLSDNFDLKKALKKISKEDRTKALQLLGEIEKRSPELTFNSKGVIVIDGESIPLSNFFLFLPLLYKKRIPKSLPGFPDFLAKLNSMGLYHLFSLKKSYKAKVKLENEFNTQLKERVEGPSKSWWLLK